MSASNITALTATIVENAKSAIDTYISTATQNFQELDNLIKTLTGSEFKGDAANGYVTFYTNRIVPALTTNLTEPGSSLTASLKSMLDNIKQSLLDTVDQQLGQQNETL